MPGGASFVPGIAAEPSHSTSCATFGIAGAWAGQANIAKPAAAPTPAVTSAVMKTALLLAMSLSFLAIGPIPGVAGGRAMPGRRRRIAYHSSSW